MNLRRLLALAILLPSAFVVGVILLSYLPHDAGLLSHSQEHVILSVVIVLGIIPFSFLMLRIFRGIEKHIIQQNEQLARRSKEMEALLRVGHAMESSLELDRILPAALEAILETTSAEAAEVWLLDPRQGELSLRCHRGAGNEAFQEITKFRLGEGYPGVVAQSGEAILVHNLPDDARFLRQLVKTAGFYTYYAVPLRGATGQVNGVLGVAARNPNALTSQDELRLLRLMADRMAASVDNARLHQEVQTMAVVAERERLAREMHDGLAQVLGYVNTKAQAVKELLASGQVEAAKKQVEQLEEAAQDTYDDVREAILALGTNGRKQSLADCLRTYVERFSEMSGIATNLAIEGEAHPFDPATEFQILRIAQEALANARKHAQASHIRVLLSFNSDHCHLEVADNGCGFDPSHLARTSWPHLGLQSMQERAAAIGARFTLDTAPGKGTKVIVDLPKGAV